ncbi:MAG: hypothetical protein QXL40_01260 [Nitrososphaerota archaeon]
MAEKTVAIWSDHRWRVLFDVARLDRLKVWEIRLVEILRTLIKELEKLGVVDLNPCGVALYSASIIHRMKSERLLKADLPSQPREKITMPPLPPIDIPIQPEVVLFTLQDVLKSLSRILYEENVKTSFVEHPQENFMLNIEEYLVKLEEKVEEFVKTLQDLFHQKKNDEIDFRELVSCVDRLEAVRRFILLLLAAARGYVEILQDEETGEIKVKWIGGKELSGDSS